MQKKLTVLLLILCLGTFSACAGGGGNRKGNGSPVEPIHGAGTIRLPADGELRTSGASLLNDDSPSSFFQDLRAFRVGDLVTINIVETSKAEKQADTKTSRASSLSAGVDNLLGYEAKMGQVFPAAFDNKVMFKGSMANDFNGSGSTSRDESMTAAITGRVMKVLTNGNLYIEGTRQIRVNNEVQFITLSGIIRPSDISPDNTVLSSYIADARIDYTGSGPVSDKQRPGWLARILDNVWPF